MSSLTNNSVNDLNKKTFKIARILFKMEEEGLSTDFTFQLFCLAQKYEGIFDLLILWINETDQNERDEIIADLQDEIEELARISHRLSDNSHTLSPHLVPQQGGPVLHEHCSHPAVGQSAATGERFVQRSGEKCGLENAEIIKSSAYIHFDNLDLIAENVMEFKKALRTEIERWGGISKLSKATGIPIPSLSRFLNTPSLPRRITLEKIARALNLRESDLLSKWAA